ncbi:hypothetical protein G6F50_014734 [Rhizopus delemar]|uniref:Uncharacterized protein n=1 Tax=Rhizopus delemar TaxID=936053 RepID=A0A9P7C704_9FUNG|nr:hypothetical protein G6F50_014734 [Rhizopus delemar]
MKASAVSKKSSRPKAGNSSSISSNLWRRSMPSLPSSDSVSRRPIWLRIRRMSGLVREMSEGGTTRYSDTGCSTEMRSAMRQSQREVTSATVGSRYRPRNDMAVDKTPERSLSDLLSTSRAADATTG